MRLATAGRSDHSSMAGARQWRGLQPAGVRPCKDANADRLKPASYLRFAKERVDAVDQRRSVLRVGGLASVAGGLVDRGQLEHRARRGFRPGETWRIPWASARPSCEFRPAPERATFPGTEASPGAASSRERARLACATSAASLRRTSGRRMSTPTTNTPKNHEDFRSPGRTARELILPEFQLVGGAAAKAGKFGSNPLGPVAREAAQVLRHGNLVHEIVVDDPLAPLQLEPIPVMRELREQSRAAASFDGGVGSNVSQPKPGK